MTRTSKPNSARQPIDWNDRQLLATPIEMKYLEQFATQPGNCRSRKPARLIWLYTQGNSHEEILADLRVSEATLEKWFQWWIDDGVRGVTGGAEFAELKKLYY